MKSKSIPVYLTLTEQAYERIDRLSVEAGRSKCRYIRQIIRRYLEYLDKLDQPGAEPVDWRID